MTGKGRPPKYVHLLDDRNVERWYEQTAKGARETANVFLRRLGHVCEKYETTPQRIARLGKKGIRDLLADIIDDMDSHGYAGGYIASTMKVVKSWLRFNLRPVSDIRLRIPRANETPTVAQEMIPTKEELQKVFNAKSIRAKVAVAFAAFTAVRPEVLGKGDEGLTLGDIVDLEWDSEKKIMLFKNMPAAVRVRPALSKTGHGYVTYLNAQGCGYLKQYLEGRLRDGERFEPETAVLTIQYRTQVQNRPKLGDTVSKKRGDFVHTQHVRALLKSAIVAAGFKWRPYVLRRYFDTNMLLHAQRLIKRDYTVFMMGHKGDIEHIYTLHKGLPEETLEEMRREYAEASARHLETSGATDVTKDAVLNMVRRELLASAGSGQEEVEKLGDLSSMPQDEFEKMIDRKWQEKFGLGNGNKQKVVAKDEVRALIADGWEFVTWFDEARAEAIVRLPSG
jgi:hypothetical protein